MCVPSLPAIFTPLQPDHLADLFELDTSPFPSLSADHALRWRHRGQGAGTLGQGVEHRRGVVVQVELAHDGHQAGGCASSFCHLYRLVNYELTRRLLSAGAQNARTGDQPSLHPASWRVVDRSSEFLLRTDLGWTDGANVHSSLRSSLHIDRPSYNWTRTRSSSGSLSCATRRLSTLNSQRSSLQRSNSCRTTEISSLRDSPS